MSATSPTSRTHQSVTHPGFFEKHKMQVLVLTATAALITSLALAILCWPAAFGAVGALAASYGITTGLANAALIAKILIAAAPLSIVTACLLRIKNLTASSQRNLAQSDQNKIVQGNKEIKKGVNKTRRAPKITEQQTNATSTSSSVPPIPKNKSSQPEESVD